MKIYDDTTIYVFAPANLFTGGPNSIHQLASALKKFDFDVQMVYYNPKDPTADPVHPWLRKYHLPYTGDVRDDPKNIFIFPESVIMTVPPPKKAQLVIWWMSVDYFFITLRRVLGLYIDDREILKVPAPIRNPFQIATAEHLYQSEYARRFIEINAQFDGKILHELRGYLSPQFYSNYPNIDLASKEDIIAYNPSKGFEFTQKIMESAPDLTFVPIKNMTADEVQNLLARSKIYMDFGFHPGRERIPREAAMSHCVVITGRRGSAGNDIDVAIPNDFKFDDSIGNDENVIPKIVKKLRKVMKNFKAEHDRQNSYRERTSHEKENFFRDVQELFGNRNRKKHVAIIGNPDELEFLYNELIEQNDIEIVFLVNDELSGAVASFGDVSLEIISEEDAIFLFNEGRIDRFVTRR